MEKKKDLKPTQSNMRPSKDDDNISTLREILFGNKMTEFEKRFDELEKHLEQEIATFRDEVNGLYKSLETFIKREQKSLSENLKEEQSERLKGEKKIREDIDTLSQKLVEFKSETGESQRDIRQVLLDQHKNLSDDLLRVKKDLQAALDSKTTALEDKKVSRLALANLLSDLALQLGKESPASDDDSR